MSRYSPRWTRPSTSRSLCAPGNRPLSSAAVRHQLGRSKEASTRSCTTCSALLPSTGSRESKRSLSEYLPGALTSAWRWSTSKHRRAIRSRRRGAAHLLSRAGERPSDGQLVSGGRVESIRELAVRARARRVEHGREEGPCPDREDDVDYISAGEASIGQRLHVFCSDPGGVGRDQGRERHDRPVAGIEAGAARVLGHGAHGPVSY